MTEEQVRQIVRDELAKIEAERSAVIIAIVRILRNQLEGDSANPEAASGCFQPTDQAGPQPGCSAG